jgi:DHA1 family tetracycline resistance protein-like MFS transporter
MTATSLARRGLFALALVLFLGLAGFGVILPVFPFWGRELGASPTEVTLAMGAFSLGQFVGAPLWGKLSDRIGRKPAMVGSLLGAGVAYFLMAGAQDIWWLGLTRLLAGLMAGNVAVAFAYAGDVTTPDERPRVMGLLGAAFALGFILGPAIGGLIAGDTPSTAAYARVGLWAAAMCGVAALSVVFALPESLTDERRARAAAHGGAPALRALIAAKPLVAWLTLLNFLALAAAALMEATFALWADDILGFSPRDVGLSFGLVGLISAAAQALLAAPLARRFGASRVVVGALAMYTAGLAGLAMATGPLSALVTLGITAVGVGLYNPAFQTIVADATNDADRGLINGVTQGGSSLGRIAGPIAGGPIYEGFSPSAPFAFGAVAMLASLALAAAMAWPSRRSARKLAE